MSTDLRCCRLEGLEPDNLMAFLALLGTLRALDCARPEWHARAAFDLATPPVRPCLYLAVDVAPDAICEAVADSAKTLLSALDLGERDDLKQNAGPAREALRCANSRIPEGQPARFNADLLAALGSDGGRPEDEPIAVSPLCFPTVAQVNFIASIRQVAKIETPMGRGGSKHDSGTPPDAIRRALFAPWERKDRPAGLRWDPLEARQHAHQWSAPTDEMPTSELGAVRLALIGLSCFPLLPSTGTAQAKAPLPGGRTVDGNFALVWPIWRHPMSLTSIRSLIAHPALDNQAEQQRLGIETMMRAIRIGLGKYVAFTRAVPLAIGLSV